MKNVEKPMFAVLLAAYNGEKYIEQQIKSVFNQKNVNVKIFVSLDKSNDSTKKVCEKFVGDNFFILDDLENNFGSAGKNFYRLFRDVDFNGFDYICLSDQDDIWKENKLFFAHESIVRNNASGYSSDVECFWESGRNNKIVKKSFKQKKFDYYFEPAGPGCTYVLKNQLASDIKKEILKNNNLPFHHDWFIYAYARFNNFKWIIDSRATILYRQHDKNQVGANLGFKQYIRRINKLRSGDFKKEVNEIFNFFPSIDLNIFNIRKYILINPFYFRRSNKEAIFLFVFALLGWL